MIEARDLTLRSGKFQLTRISLRIERGECVLLMGPSGSGKTTLLEAICGLRSIDSGRLLLRGADAAGLSPAERRVGYVPQDLALFSTMDVRANLAYGLRRQNLRAQAVHQRVREVAELLGIVSLLARRTVKLSGGEARRVAIGRAIATRPDILLLDEPLTGLDADTREEVAAALRVAREQTQAAVVHVTHDPRDKESTADRVLHLEAGALIVPPKHSE